ncbi:hypothetical protein BaRGS_00005643 [Batillaria attramentaria]|uniref:Uncharacterized protein n=1 Tax=Batillaria attramentaria TaxID=370345 RepID=A0ABD0LUP7_9CAEN
MFLLVTLFYREGRYDAVCRADSKVQRAWRQKSLDEKKLRFVMKRSSMPAHLSSSSYINHGVLANHKAGAGPQKTNSKGNDSKKRSPILKPKQRVYIDDFSDFDCLLEEESSDNKDGGSSVRYTVAGGGRLRDCECQTGDDLIQAMFSQLRRRRPAESDSSTPSPHHPPPEFLPVKNVTFNTHVVPVHIDSPWHQQSRDQSAGAEALSPLGRHYDDANYLQTGEGGDRARGSEFHRRLSDGSSLSYADGVSSPETPLQGPRRCSDTSDVSSKASLQNFHHHHNIYHRPPTPRTPRKLIIQNTDGAGVDPLSPSMSRDSLPSPHLLHVHSTPQRIATAPSSLSLNSNTSQGSRGSKRGRKGREVQSEDELSPDRGGVDAGGEREEEGAGVIEFQQYLHDRGLTLDMSSVQTSDL